MGKRKRRGKKKIGRMRMRTEFLNFIIAPTPHERVITIGITPWSNGCPHIFTGLHLPGGGL